MRFVTILILFKIDRYIAVTVTGEICYDCELVCDRIITAVTDL